MLRSVRLADTHRRGARALRERARHGERDALVFGNQPTLAEAWAALPDEFKRAAVAVSPPWQNHERAVPGYLEVDQRAYDFIAGYARALQRKEMTPGHVEYAAQFAVARDRLKRALVHSINAGFKE